MCAWLALTRRAMPAGGGGLTTGSIRRVTEVSEALERKMHHLQRFSLTNYTAAYKVPSPWAALPTATAPTSPAAAPTLTPGARRAVQILKKYDKVTGESRMEPTMNEVAAMPFAAKTLGTLSAALEAGEQGKAGPTQPGRACAAAARPGAGFRRAD